MQDFEVYFEMNYINHKSKVYAIDGIGRLLVVDHNNILRWVDADDCELVVDR